MYRSDRFVNIVNCKQNDKCSLGYSTPRTPPYNLLFLYGQIMILLLVSTSVSAILNGVINQKSVNTDWNCKGSVGSIWNHSIFCKIVDSWAPNNLLKGFQILVIVYIFDQMLCSINRACFEKMLQILLCNHLILKDCTTILSKQSNGSLMVLQEFIATHASCFIDYIIIDGTLLDGAWESEAAFV